MNDPLVVVWLVEKSCGIIRSPEFTATELTRTFVHVDSGNAVNVVFARWIGCDQLAGYSRNRTVRLSPGVVGRTQHEIV